MRKDPNIGAKGLQQRLQDEHKVIISYDQVWKGLQVALRDMFGSWEESFQMLFRWKEEVHKRSPGSVVEIDTKFVDGRLYFHRFFCALKPCIEGFVKGCRPYLSVDSTTLNVSTTG